MFDTRRQLGSPRLVEYWEQDPCHRAATRERRHGDRRCGRGRRRGATPATTWAEDNRVKVEAKFAVGEYDIVILSAKDSTGLDAWLNATPLQDSRRAPSRCCGRTSRAASKFFVAKVDPKKVKFVDGHAALSPLRFHYDSDDFALPIRLGLANSSGKQDLIVNILAPDQRYEVANYKNVTIPTNFDVTDAVQRQVRRVLRRAVRSHASSSNPGAVVTEYAWARGDRAIRARARR